MKTYLKIKIKSLAAEAVIIKREEQRWKAAPFTVDNTKLTHPLYFSLRHHRLFEVRNECRSAIIAYGYLRGLAYKQIEAKCHESPNWERIAELIRKYGPAGKYFSAEARKQLAEDLKLWASVPALPKDEAA
jgi:hypothetical protein